MKKILVIDDDADMRLYVSSILQAQGFEVKSVETGCEAMSAMRNEFFDLVVMDILLPDTNGLDLCKKVKEFNVSSMPVILLSSVTDDAVIRSGLEEKKADAFMAKPPSPLELVRRALGLLNGAGSQGGALGRASTAI
ncbi:MAG TPA: response regulator transcription factor [Elusimicrobiota bacterium]|nr:response regulator transcription factor [Elusimicrobiota bacterium]